MKAAYVLVFLLLAHFGSAASADPIVTVHKDKLNLSSELSIPLLAGGVLQQTQSFSGALLPGSRRAKVLTWLREDDEHGDSFLVAADASAHAHDDAFYMEAYAYNTYSSWPGAPNGVIVDRWADIEAIATADLSWVFSSSEDTSARIYMSLASSLGSVGVRLYDKSARKTVFKFSADSWADFEELTGHAGSYGGSVDIPILAGHRYALSAYASDWSLHDDDETVFDFSFDDAGSFKSVPEPQSFLLFGMLLILLSTMKRLATIKRPVFY